MSTMHHMRLKPDAFEAIESGKKTREYRLNDEKRQQVRLGDTIEFQKLPDLGRRIMVRVTGLLLYENWRSCYEDFFQQDLSDHYASIEDAVQDTYAHWWPKEKEEKYGCLIIKFTKIHEESMEALMNPPEAFSDEYHGLFAEFF